MVPTVLKNKTEFQDAQNPILLNCETNMYINWSSCLLKNCCSHLIVFPLPPPPKVLLCFPFGHFSTLYPILGGSQEWRVFKSQTSIHHVLPYDHNECFAGYHGMRVLRSREGHLQHVTRCTSLYKVSVIWNPWVPSSSQFPLSSLVHEDCSPSFRAVTLSKAFNITLSPSSCQVFTTIPIQKLHKEL